MNRKIIVLVSGMSVLAATASFLLAGARANRNLVQGGTPDVQALLSQTLDAFNHEGIVSVEASSPPAGVIANSSVTSGDSWLKIVVPANEPLADAVYHANLLSTGFNARADSEGVLPISGYSLFIEGRTGSDIGQYVKIVPSKMSTPVVPSDTAAAEGVIRARFSDGSQEAGASLTNIRFFTIPGLSVDATVSVNDPTDFVRNLGERLHSIVGDDSGYDAREVRITGPDGAPIVISGYNNDLGAGSTWIRPDLVRQSTGLYGQPVKVQP